MPVETILDVPLGADRSISAPVLSSEVLNIIKVAQAKKKEYINGRRNDPAPEASPAEAPVDSCETGVDQTIVLHIQLTTSLIEGRAVGLKEVIRMVEKILRQLSFEKSKKMLYIHCQSQIKPP